MGGERGLCDVELAVFQESAVAVDALVVPLPASAKS